MILTDDEIYSMYSEAHSDAQMIVFAREVEAAVVARLAAGVSVEPEYLPVLGTYKVSYGLRAVYTLDQLQAAIAAARVQENERCACLAENTHPQAWAFIGCAIRALLQGEKT